MIFSKQEVVEKKVGSYLFEIFKLEPTFSDHFNMNSDSDVSMVDFINAHHPKSIYLENLEQILFPYLSAKKSLTKNVLQYKELIAELDETESIENLKPDEKANLQATKNRLPSIINTVNKDKQALAEMEIEINNKLSLLKKTCNSHSAEFKSKQIATIHKVLDSLKIPREQFQDKEIDNPLNFVSYKEVVDYIDRQTTLKKEHIPLKNLEKAEYDNETFQQLLVYLALVDCLLPLGIVYDR